MAFFSSDTTAADGEIDMDRVIVDPHYRQRVIARLRSQRLQSQAADLSAESENRPIRDSTKQD